MKVACTTFRKLVLGTVMTVMALSQLSESRAWDEVYKVYPALSIYEYIGRIADAGEACVFDEAPHVHHSGDISPSTPVYRITDPNQTCWTNENPNGTYYYQCPGFHKEHYTCS